MIRNSAAEFLIFTGQASEQGIEARYEDETRWLSQKLMAELFGVDMRTVSEHLKNVFASQALASEAVIRKFRITASDGKNYLTKDELDALGRIVNAYLELAEDRARRKIPMSMEDWSKRLDAFLEFDGREVPQDSGKVPAKLSQTHTRAASEFEKCRIVQDPHLERGHRMRISRIDTRKIQPVKASGVKAQE